MSRKYAEAGSVVHSRTVLLSIFLVSSVFGPVRPANAAGDVIVFSAGLDILGSTLGQLFGSEERGGIHIMRPDGSGLRQLTSFQTKNFRWQPDIFNLPDDHPTVSPDGKFILFTSSRADDGGLLAGSGGTDNFEIFIMRVNGSGIRQLTNLPGVDAEAVFSPDGTKIAFSSQCALQPADQCLATLRDTKPNIFVMDPDGNILQRVTSSAFSDIEPAWTPDGTKIVYTRVTDEGSFILGDEQKQVRVADADGTNKNDHLLFDRLNQDHDPNVRPNGADILITSELAGTLPYGDVVRINAATGQLLANLTIDDTLFGVGGGGDPAYSPDGTRIAYIKAQLGIVRGPQKIHVMNADGSNKHKLDQGIPGLLNIHQNWGILADSDGDGTPDYLENSNTSFTREAVTGFGLFGQEVATRSQAGEQFGAAMALADLNHDGRPDLIIGSPGLDEAGLIPNSGGVAIVPGTRFGPQFAPTLIESLSTVLERLAAERPTPTANGRFGQTLASGDFNGDGFTDVAIGAPGQNQVLVMFGGSSSLVLSGSGGFGSALAVGDFNNDGFADLAVGAPTVLRTVSGSSVATGAVAVYHGTSTGFSFPQTIDQGSLPVATDVGKLEAGDRFGAALAAGDVDGDGVDDLVIGVPGEDINGVADAGLVHVIPGRAGQQLPLSLAVSRDARSLPSPFGVLQTGAQFGSVLAIGHFKTTSLSVHNLVVGIPQQDVTTVEGKFSIDTPHEDAGIVAIFDGRSPLLTSSDPLGTGVVVWTAATLGDVVRAQGRFGQTLAVGNLTGDNASDLAIAAPGQTAGGAAQAGMVFLVPGTGVSDGLPVFCSACGASGLAPSAAQILDQTSVGTRPEANDRFGGSLVFPTANTMVAGDMDGDGQDDLFIGSPEEDGSASATGLVSVRYGIRVGTVELVPSSATVRSGHVTTFEFTWTHPERWRDLESIHFRLANDERSLFWVRFDIADNLLRLVSEDSQGKGRQEGAPGSHGILRTDAITLDLHDTELVTSGPAGRSVTLRLPLRLAARVPAGDYRVEFFTTDVHGNSQGFEQAGTLTVVSPANR